MITGMKLKTAVLCGAMAMMVSSVAMAQDRSSVGSNIVINQGETARDVACVMC